MRPLLVLTVAASAALLVVGGASAQRSAGVKAGSSTSTTGYIVVLKETVANVDAEVDRLTSAAGVTAKFRYYHALKGFAASLSQDQADAFRADSDVDFVSVDHVGTIASTVPIRPGETVPPGIRRIEAAVGNQIPKKSKWAVAISDTGIDLNHTDLNARDGIDCTGPPPAQDDNGHGTHVAGTVAAKNQGSGVVGISPGTTVYSIKWIFASGNGNESGAICGFDWLVENAKRLKIKAVNMSWRFPEQLPIDDNCGQSSNDPVHMAICEVVEAGVLPVGAAGNEAQDFRTWGRPPAYNEVLTVTAIADNDGQPGGLGGAFCSDIDDTFAGFSSFGVIGSGDEAHTVAAPGVCVLSTRLGGGTTTLSGTSMAAPHVAGTVVNCLGQKRDPGPCRGMNPTQILNKIRADAIAKPPSYGFLGDPAHTPPPGRYYGFLVSNAGYAT
jgi:subtilisin family serine protease